MIIDRYTPSYPLYALDLAGLECRHIRRDSKSPARLSSLDLAGIDHYKKKDIEKAKNEFEKNKNHSSQDCFSIKRTDRKTLNEKNLQHIDASKSGVRLQDLYLPFPEFKKSDPSIKYSGDCEELKKLIESTVEEVIDPIDFNGLITVVELLKYLESRSDQKECLALHEFRASCKDEVELFHGGGCVSACLAILKKIQEKFGIEGELLVEKGGLHNSFYHAACAIRCQNGWVLIEAGWDKGQKVQAVPFGVSKTAASGSILEARVEQSKSSSGIVPILYRYTPNKERHEYYNTIANVDTLIMTSFCLRNYYIPVVAYENGKAVAAIKVWQKIKTVILQMNVGKNTIPMTFSFHDVDSLFKDKLKKFMEGKFKSSHEDVYFQIQTIVSLSDRYCRLLKQLKIGEK